MALRIERARARDCATPLADVVRRAARARAAAAARSSADDGSSGAGEAAPLEPYDGVPLDDGARRARRVRRAIARGTGPTRGDASCSTPAAADADLPQALAAVDLALWDRAGRREGRPSRELLADEPLARDRVNATIGASDRAGAAARRGAAARGRLRLREAQGRHRRRRRARRRGARRRRAATCAPPGRERRVGRRRGACARSDARSRRAGLELVEEPVHGVEGCARCASGPRARRDRRDRGRAGRARAPGAADAVCLKLSRCGGIAGAARPGGARAHDAAREPYLASTLDGPLGIAAARALRGRAAARDAVRPGDARAVRTSSASNRAPRRGEVPVPDGPGLGVYGAALVERTPRQGPVGARPGVERSAAASAVGRLAAAARDRRPGSTSSARAGSAAAIRSASARELRVALAARSSVTGHRQLAEPVPQRRHRRRCRGRAAPRPSAAGSLRRCPSRRGAADAARVAREQRLRRPAVARTPRSTRLDLARRAARRQRAGRARSRVVLDAGASTPTSTSRATRSGAASATCSATRPPIE